MSRQAVRVHVKKSVPCIRELRRYLEVVDAIASALVSGELSRSRVEEAERRIDECCAKFCAPAPPGAGAPADPSGRVGTVEHKTRMSEALQARL